jgi:hypothetical protein
MLSIWVYYILVLTIIFHMHFELTFNNVATLALGSQPKQGLAKVRAKSEAQESHFMLLGM